MARVSHDKAMKDMVGRVKELCQDVDDNSIHILLQQYDFNVEQTVQAILDGSAEETLREWKSLGVGAKTTAAKKKKKNKNKNSAQNHESANGPSVQTVNNHVTSNISGPCNGGILSDQNGLNGAFLNESEHLEPLESRVTLFNQPSEKHSTSQSRPKEDYKQQTKKGRDRTLSEASSSSAIDRPSKGGSHAGLEKSLKDLQRQTVSLQRLKVVLNEQVDKSFKRISEVFKELHNQLNEREAQLIFTMDKVKTQANDVLEEQQLRAADLKHQTDRAQAMKDSELADLRSRIKIFVSERKHYEDLSHAQRFVCDFNHIFEEVKNFGEVVPVKAVPDHRRASVASLASCLSHEETSPRKPSTTATPTSPAQLSSSSHRLSTPVSVPDVAPVSSASTTTAAAAAAATAFVPNSAHVLMQSESLTKYEATEMAQRLANLALDDSKVSPPSTFRSSRPDRGRGSRGRGSGNLGTNTDRSVKTNSNDQSKDTQSGRGRGRGRGQGRSNRGHGESGNATESLANDDQRSNRSKDRNARSNVDGTAAQDEASSNTASSTQAQAPKSPGDSPRRGGRRRGGGQHDTLSARSVGNSRPTREPITDHDGSSGDTGKLSATNNNDIMPSSKNSVVDGVADGQPDALPQRGTRSNRRGGRSGGGDKQATENRLIQEPVLANGE